MEGCRIRPVKNIVENPVVRGPVRIFSREDLVAGALRGGIKITEKYCRHGGGQG